MASLFKPSYTLPLPAGAEIVTHKRKPHARFKDKDGQTVVAPLTKKGDRCRLKVEKWYGQYTDADGLAQRVPLSENKTVAQQMLNEIVRKVELAKVGIIDRFEQHRRCPLLCRVCQGKGRTPAGDTCACPDGAHLTDYRRSLEAKDHDPRYVSQVASHCAAVLDGTAARFLPDLDANKVEMWLADLRRDTAVGISTSNHYLTDVKGFTRWLTKCRPPRLPNDPLACLSKLNEETDVRRRRRDLNAGEAVRLLEATVASARGFRGLSGEDRTSTPWPSRAVYGPGNWPA